MDFKDACHLYAAIIPRHTKHDMAIIYGVTM